MKVAWADTAVESTNVFSGSDTGAVVQAVLVVLIVMSVLTWAIVAYKYWRRRIVNAADSAFLTTFYAGRDLREIAGTAERQPESGAAQLYMGAFKEMETLKRHRRGRALDRESLTRVIERALDRAAVEVRLNRERYLTFLATVASGAPFIGLFGTVWGIMNSFAEIGKTGSASLAVVAPGISEALIATAVGLLAAIPAAWFYNYLQRAIDEEDATLLAFRLELLNLLEAFVFNDVLSDEGTLSTDTPGRDSRGLFTEPA